MWESAQNAISTRLHKVRTYEYKGTKILAYEYPYRFNSTYIHISCAISYLEMIHSTSEVQTFFEYILSDSGALFLKINFAPSSDSIDVMVLLSHMNTPLHCYQTDSIQIYGSTYIVPIQELTEFTDKNYSYDIHKSDDIAKFLIDTNSFWLQRSKDIRNSNRRALKSKWVIQSNYQSNVSQDVFDDWYEIYVQTAKRQQFNPHPKAYMFAQWQLPYSRAFVLYLLDDDGHSTPVSCWLGYLHNTMLTYLHGGNLETGFASFSQYLAHVIAFMIAYNESCNMYDLGGYISGTGFAQFKDKYKGEIVYFPGPIDITTSPIQYSMIETLPNKIKQLKKKFSQK